MLPAVVANGLVTVVFCYIWANSGRDPVWLAITVISASVTVVAGYTGMAWLCG